MTVCHLINIFSFAKQGIFVTKIIPNGPAAVSLRPGDKLLEVSQNNFTI